MCELLHSNPTTVAPCIVNVHLIGIKKNSSTYMSHFHFLLCRLNEPVSNEECSTKEPAAEPAPN